MSPETAESARKPPQALEAEAAVLGAMLLEPRTVPTVVEYLRPPHFYLGAHRKVYEAILHLFEHDSPTDIVTVTSELKRMKEFEAVGGQQFLSGLLDTVLTTANCEEHAKLVLERAVQRQLIQTATEIVQAGYDEGRRADQLLEEAEQRIFEIRETGDRSGFAELKGLLDTEAERINRAMLEKKLITGLETGYAELDQLTSGLQPGELVIVAGRPSMGKTSLALNIAANAALRGDTIAIFSLEMSTESLVQRLICAEGNIRMFNLRRGRLAPDEKAGLVAALGKLATASMYIDDTPGLSSLDIRARARRLRAKSELSLIVIDYLQLMESHSFRRGDPNRQQEISDITRSLKAMAKELNVPVMVLSQLSRAPDRRDDKRPQLSDLRESGSIEQDADVVMFLYREAAYRAKDIREMDENEKRKSELIVAKQRNGPVDNIELVFLYEYMRFASRAFGPMPEPPPRQDDGYDDMLPE
jgi:replicative DNA helicase